MQTIPDLRVTAGPSLREQVADRIREAITSGQFEPGTRLVERELCDMTGVSRTSLREALRDLVAQGLLLNVPNKGLIVAILGPDEAREIYQVRAVLEGLAARLFIQNTTAERLAELETAFEQLRKQYDADQPEPFLTLKDAFYEKILEGSGNQTIGSMLRQIHARLRRLQCASISSKGRRQELIEQAGLLCDALGRGDAELAWSLSLANVQRACEITLARMDLPDASSVVSIMSDRERAALNRAESRNASPAISTEQADGR